MDSPQLNSVRLFCCLFQLCNETVSMGDTAVSLHILGEGVFLATQKRKVPSPDQIFIFPGGGQFLPRTGYSWQN